MAAMKRNRHAIALTPLAAMLSVTALPAAARSVSAPALIPLPAEMTIGRGAIRIASGDRIGIPANDPAAERATQQAIDLLAKLGGPKLTIDTGGKGRITLSRTPTVTGGAEAYRLDVTANGIAIDAADDAGLRHSTMTLVQLLTPAGAGTGASVSVPQLAIRDRPRFAWRGVMLDVARHMQPVAEIRTVIDMMAQHKLNTLQLHLTDDQGWRMEIKRYPKLTAIGAWRNAPVTGSPTEGARYGGFYTQDELRGLVAYAADRGITIVPEIDMPGHAQAAIAAYPEIGVFGDTPVVSPDWGINPYLFGVHDQSFALIEGVLDEVMAVFPSTFIHVGGDEALKHQWQESPAVQAKMRALNIPDEEHLQSWFIDRLGKYLTAHGRKLIGWDEILEGGLPASASVMSWRGEAGAIAAANAGHDVVLSPGPVLYFDNLQSARGDEQPGRVQGMTPLEKVYAYDPMPGAIAADKAHHVLGAQANLWAEYIVTPTEAEHALFPRVDALAEIAWSPKDKRDWKGFLTRLEPQMTRYAKQSVAVADSAFAVDFAVAKPLDTVLRDKKAAVALSNQAGHGTITFTTDGSAPTPKSRRYTQPLTAPFGTTIRARSFAADGTALAATRSFDATPTALLTRDNAALAICPGAGIRLRLPLTPDQVAGPAYSVNIYDTCWTYAQAPVAQIDRIDVMVGRLARNFALREPQRRTVKWRYNATRHGTLVVHLDKCDGPIVASAAIPDPATSANRLTLSSAITLPPGITGVHELCLTTNPPENGPIYAIESVALHPKDD
ncbi:family 20 glycosylhydrolase [Sphingomonas sp. GB1N7]|uniref:family 20 glycosylhydrolase n=1 Tax=Parasphingomonas caseinilytica TaxID=3096158 RepID=UPI002FC7C575